jgi:hypothetical protein
VVLAVMQLHGARVNVRLERRMVVRQRREMVLLLEWGDDFEGHPPRLRRDARALHAFAHIWRVSPAVKHSGKNGYRVFVGW